MPTIIQGIIIFMNEFDYTTTLFVTHTCPCLIEVGLLSISSVISPVTQFNVLSYKITPSSLFSVPSTIDGLKQLQIYEVMRFTRA